MENGLRRFLRTLLMKLTKPQKQRRIRDYSEEIETKVCKQNNRDKEQQQ